MATPVPSSPRPPYTFPPEYHPQSAVWFSWPRPEGISFPGKYHPIPDNLCRIMHAIMVHGRQKVRINVPNENYEHIVRQHLREARVPAPLVRKYVEFFHIRTNESWCRDHGPAFVVPAHVDGNRITPRAGGPRKGAGKRASSDAQPPLAVVDWGFNAWGGKYPPWNDDDAVSARIAEHFKLPLIEPTHARGGGEPVTINGKRSRRIVMEGGAVDFNGLGTVLTTTSCLLNPNRNPKMSRRDVEAALKQFYGQSHVCWLGEGIVGDDTDGHIDDLARFLDPRTIVIAVEPDRKDANHEILEDNRRRAAELRDQDGEPFRIVEIPMPGVIEHDGQRLPATYLNFLFINNAVLVPTFRHKKSERRALAILQDHLPNHRVVGVDCLDLIWGLGAIHCLTQQEPKPA